MNRIIADVRDYYTNKLLSHGATPRGVDWNGVESQVLRFSQLARVIESGRAFSVNDLGCGYGALLTYLRNRVELRQYFGIDISEEMIAVAKSIYGAEKGVHFITASMPEQVADYGMASGIFNVRMGHADQEWRAYIESTLDVLNNTSLRGFSFNCLTSYSDPEKMRDDLFYSDPLWLFDYCKRQFSSEVALLHDYGLYEFTILVKKK